MIWTYSSQFTRYVDLWPSEHGKLQDGTAARPNSILDFPFLRHVTTRPPPPVLHACRESRKVALQYYSLEFGSKHVLEHDMTILTPPRIYINWSSDIICPIHLAYTMSLSGTDNEWEHEVFGRKEIRRMALNVKDVGDGLLPSLDALDEIILYYAPSPPYSYQETGYDMIFEEFEVNSNVLKDADLPFTSTLDATVIYIEELFDDLLATRKLRPEAIREARITREFYLQSIERNIEHINRNNKSAKARFMLMTLDNESGDAHQGI